MIESTLDTQHMHSYFGKESLRIKTEEGAYPVGWESSIFDGMKTVEAIKKIKTWADPPAPSITPLTHPRVYVSGPMTSTPERPTINFNYDAFQSAARHLRRLGFSVTNPAENFGGDQTKGYLEYLRLDIRQITGVDAVALLPGWEHSKGAGMEVTVAGFLGLPLVDYETLLPISQEQPKPVLPAKTPKYNLVAFAGYARAGKDEAAKALIERGFEKQAFGDIIKARVCDICYDDLAAIFAWVRENEVADASVLHSLVKGYQAVLGGAIFPFTENDAEKKVIRTLLERYGEAFYDEILKEYMSTLPEKCVNTRIVRVEEARAWKEAGGVIFHVVRAGVEPATDWERDRLNELKNSGFIDGVIYNFLTVDSLHSKVLSSVGLL